VWLTRNRLRFHRASSDRNHYTIIVRQLNLDLIGESNSPRCKINLGKRTSPAASILGTIITPQQRHLENVQREVEQDDAALFLFLSLTLSPSGGAFSLDTIMVLESRTEFTSRSSSHPTSNRHWQFSRIAPPRSQTGAAMKAI